MELVTNNPVLFTHKFTKRFNPYMGNIRLTALAHAKIFGRGIVVAIASPNGHVLTHYYVMQDHIELLLAAHKRDVDWLMQYIDTYDVAASALILLFLANDPTENVAALVLPADKG